MKNNLETKIGIALSGGAARGIAHLGVLKALEENGIYPTHLAGTSAGAFMAALYAFDFKVDDILELVNKMKWQDVSGFAMSKLGLLSNSEVGDILDERLGKANIEDALKPLAIVAADITTGEQVVFRSGSVAKAVMASSAIPGIFRPVEYQNRLFVDGMIVENIPVSPLSDMSVDIILAVNLSSGVKYTEPDDIFSVIMNAFSITVDSASSDSLTNADITIKPRVSDFSRTDLTKSPELLEQGYKAAIAKLNDINRMLNSIRDKRTVLGRIKHFFKPRK